jgi:cellobiose-specific phosphotransferase system component IIC
MSGLRLELLGSMPGERNPVQLGNIFDSIDKFLNKNSGTIIKATTLVNTASQLFNTGGSGSSGGGGASEIARQQQEAAQAEALAQEKARQESAKKSDNTILYVGIAAGGIALTVLAVALVKRKKKKSGLGRVSRKAVKRNPAKRIKKVRKAATKKRRA